MQRWQDYREQFDAMGVALVAISADTPAEAATMRERHGLPVTLLSDDSLDVTRRYNLLHERNITPKRGVVRGLAIPSTFLIDAEGTVRWIDKPDDYRSRTHAKEVVSVVGSILDGLGAARV